MYSFHPLFQLPLTHFLKHRKISFSYKGERCFINKEKQEFTFTAVICHRKGRESEQDLCLVAFLILLKILCNIPCNQSLFKNYLLLHLQRNLQQWTWKDTRITCRIKAVKKKRSRHVFSQLSRPLLILFWQAFNDQLPHHVLGVLYMDPSQKLKGFQAWCNSHLGSGTLPI